MEFGSIEPEEHGRINGEQLAHHGKCVESVIRSIFRPVGTAGMVKGRLENGEL
jgi:hypothetical protein